MPSRPSRRDGAWSVATGAVVALASVGAWYSLEVIREEQNLKTTSQFARSIAGEIEWMLRDQIRASRRLARFWLRFGRQRWDEWEFDTRLYLENNGLDSAAWLDPKFTDPLWEVGLETPMQLAREDDRARLLEAQETTVREGTERIVGPFRLQDGDHGYFMTVPVGNSAALVAGKRLGPMFTSVLASHAEQCAMRVQYSNLVLFSVDRPECRSDIKGEAPIRVFDDQVGTLIIEPSTDVVDAGNPLSIVVLTGGLLTAVLLGGVMWTRGVTRAGAAALLGVNRRLEQSMSDARATEARVRELNLELESRVRARTAALNDAIEDLETFNYSVSHDLRSPLGAIINVTAIIEEDHGARVDAEARHHLKLIQNSAMAAITMMDSLLAFSRAGRSDLEARLLDVRGLVSSVWDELTSQDAGGKTVLKVSDLPRIVADPSLLRLVFSNLMSNALKFSKTRPEVIVEVGSRLENGQVVYWVRDNGVGFRKEASERIFKVFTRLHSTSLYPGTGAGLAIVDRIITRHGGRVWCEGAPDEGATFYFSLPGGDD